MAGMNWKNEESLYSARAQYLAYRILEGYGMENVRLGDFLSDIKLQSIYNQWKTNTLLIDYHFKEINEKTEQYQLSPVENDTVIRFQNQKKINNEEKESKETVNSEQWRSTELLKQVENFFRNNQWIYEWRSSKHSCKKKSDLNLQK